MASASDKKATSGGPPAAAKLSPANPEQWNQERRDAATKEESRLYKEYMSETHGSAMDAIHNFKNACEQRKVYYADAFLSGDMTPEEYKKVDGARKHLITFWKEICKLYDECQLIYKGGDFFSPSKRWFRMGNEFRTLVEPLDIANWYKNGNHLPKNGTWGGSGHYYDWIGYQEEDNKRPSQYELLEQLTRDAVNARKTTDEICSCLDMAKEYKREAKNGGLQIQKLSDARAVPPKGFLRTAGSHTALQQNQPGGSGVLLPVPHAQPVPPPAIDVPEVKTTPSGSNTPISVLVPDVATPQSTPTPASEAVRTSLGDVSLNNPAAESSESTLAPGWKSGVRYRSATDSFTAPGRDLPEPRNADGKRLVPSDRAWDAETRKSGDINIDYNTLVYETASSQKYLTVRAKILANVDLTHDDPHHCGYFQESLTFWMHLAKGYVKVSPGTSPLPPEDSEVDVKIIEKKGTADTVGVTAKVEGSLKGPSGGIALNAGRTWTKDHAEERGFKSKRVQMGFTASGGDIAWKWTVKLMNDGSSYQERKLSHKSLPSHSLFARTSVLLEVQGTWAIKNEAKDAVVLSMNVGRTMRYDAIVTPRIGKSSLGTSVPFECDPSRRENSCSISVQLSGLNDTKGQGTALPEWDA